MLHRLKTLIVYNCCCFVCELDIELEHIKIVNFQDNYYVVYCTCLHCRNSGEIKTQQLSCRRLRCVHLVLDNSKTTLRPETSFV